jgi:pantoate--beta-alanine ligase
MFVFKSIELLQAHLSEIRAKSGAVGYVPTMGALHQGHLNLIESSKSKGCYTVCSIYVNPTQFNNAEDLAKYPNTIEHDIIKLTTAGCNVLFLPDNNEMYGLNVVASKFDFGSVTNSFEGALRPGHFDGVITIVIKLFDAVKPDEVFFGQKDLQQCVVVKHLIKSSFPEIHMNIVPTKREAGGLAMSSRNVRLTDDEKEVAVKLSQALLNVKIQVLNGTVASEAIAVTKAQLLNHPKLKLEYLALVDADTMKEHQVIETGKQYAVIIACWCANVRLIDNVLLTD